MLLDFAQVAAATASILSPFMPYLVEGGKKFAARAGDAAWEKAQALWERLRASIGEDPKITKSAELVAADPLDEGAQALFAKSLAARLSETPELVTQLTALLGGEETIQEVLADRGSWVEDVEQQIRGGGRASQIVKADQQSTIKGVKQV